MDADHASDTVTWQARTGFLVYLNNFLLYWHSKNQLSCASSTFGAQFITMKQLCKYLRDVRYKLQIMCIPYDGPAYIQGDNQSVLANTSIPNSVLKKKSQSLAYHFIRESCARGEWITSYINTHSNIADLLTKPLPRGYKRRSFVMSLLCHIYRGGGRRGWIRLMSNHH